MWDLVFPFDHAQFNKYTRHTSYIDQQCEVRQKLKIILIGSIWRHVFRANEKKKQWKIIARSMEAVLHLAVYTRFRPLHLNSSSSDSLEALWASGSGTWSILHIIPSRTDRFLSAVAEYEYSKALRQQHLLLVYCHDPERHGLLLNHRKKLIKSTVHSISTTSRIRRGYFHLYLSYTVNLI